MTPRAERLGDEAVLVRFDAPGGRSPAPGSLDEAVNGRVHAAALRLRDGSPDWVRDIVPAYACLAVFVDVDALPDDPDPLATCMAWALARCAAAGDEVIQHGALHRVGVRFGGADGPDLAAVAEAAGLSEADAVALFCTPDYRVAMLGFAPGFPYLLGLPEALAMPRLATPRIRVPAGSVAIGGAQAGLYPRDSPGGWRLLGRTDLVLFDPARSPVSLLLPGDRVRFEAAGR